MLSRPLASGAMLVLMVGVFGAAALQQGGQTVDAGIADVAGPTVPRPATAPDRVADTAGFPSVSQAERDRGQVETAGPVVTVNGEPLNSNASTPSTQAATTPSAQPTPAAQPQAPVASQTQVAAIEPPLPQPRPANLAIRTSTPTVAAQQIPAPAEGPLTPPPGPQVPAGLDYDAIANAAYGETRTAPAFSEQSSPLAPMPGVSEFGGRAQQAPNGDELVGVVGPNGEVVWVYEDQVPNMSSRVNVQRQVPSNNPFGFIFD